MNVLVLLLALLGAQSRGQEEYAKTVLPLLDAYCFDCHGDGADKGDFGFDAYPNYDSLIADRKRWTKAVLLLQSHVMPPARRKAPTLAERRALLDWIDRTVFYVDPERPDPGHTVLRRLNRAEYNNSVRDVFGVTSAPADQFPPDDSGYGFDNVGDVLALSPMLMEKVLNAARQVVDEALTPGEIGQVGMEPPIKHLEIFEGGAEKREAIVLLKDAAARVGVTADVKVAAVYRLYLQAAAEGEAELEILSGTDRVGILKVAGKWKGNPGAARSEVALVRLPAGKQQVSVRIASGKPVVAFKRFRLRGPFSTARPAPTPFMTWLLGKNRAHSVPRLSLSGEDTERGEGQSKYDTGSVGLATNGYHHAPVVLAERGRYRFRIKAGAQQAGDELARFELRMGDRKLGAFDVTLGEQRSQWLEAEADLEAGTHELQLHFINAYKDPKTGAERWVWIHEFSVEGPLHTGLELKYAGVPGLLAKTGRRLFRRPLDAGEKKRLETLVARVREAGEPPRGALRLGLMALLSSPNFIYWTAPRPAGKAERGSVPIDEFALASRLSSFLWSSVPDEELLKAAQSGELRRSFRAQVARMLADPKARAMTENFAGQWLELRDMTLVAPDPKRFPSWSPELASDMRRESELLFEHVLGKNRSVLELLTADYTFVNGRLAGHYGVDGVNGDAFRRVPLKGKKRRGILTHASILTLTSHPTRTAPVNRGNFILEKILGTPPPPAPNDVPPLPEDAPEQADWTLRQKLTAHQKDPRCASCHAFMDPMGFSLANYDAIGRWRDGVNASGKLVSGEPFKDFEELRGLIVRDRADQFVRTLTKELMTYALGRGIEFTDKTAVAKVVERSREQGYGFQDLIAAVCESVPFQKMRVPARREEK